MILRKYLFGKVLCNRKILLNDVASVWNISQFNKYSCLSNGIQSKQDKHKVIESYQKWRFILLRNRYSNGVIDGDVSQILHDKQEKDLKKIKEIFPQPRVTLNELNSRTQEKVFDIHYKQNIISPKGTRKKSKQSIDWTCSYSFVWPERVKFESTEISKRQAAEKAATQALQYLYENNRINAKGNPIYDKTVIEEAKSKLNQPICITITPESMEKIQNVWEEYESGIKQIYEDTFEKAKYRVMSTPAVLTKDSSIDNDDESPANEEYSDDSDSDLSEHRLPVHPVYGKPVAPPTKEAVERRQRALSRSFDRYDEELTPLPIDQFAHEITSTLETNRVILLVGAAGCGKSTRAPAVVLRHCGAMTTAVVSEPRRVAAIGLAERVAQEMGERVGESIGYHVRLQAKPPRPPAGSVLYCTSGVLLRRLQSNPGLVGCTHVFIDEAHERDVNTDVTLLLLKRALELNRDLRVVIMSATLDTEVFTKYFDSCPVIEVPGRTFPVTTSYLEEITAKYGISLPITTENCEKEDGRPYVSCQEIVEVIKAVDKMEPEGAILVFLPGWAEIKKAKTLLDLHFGPNCSTHIILPVHSRLSTTDQTKMFAKPLAGVRKIVLSTNIAETSITIPDVVYVIDSGAHKENRLREGTGMASLETSWVSLAGARQRAGRAGRVQPGHCYKMYTEKKESEFVAHNTPEILRIPLEPTVLDCKTYAPEEKVESFLSQLPEPPTRKAIRFAVNDLIDLAALTPGERVTPLGILLAKMTLHPRLSRALLASAAAGNLSAAANMAAHCADSPELFVDAAERRTEIRDRKRGYNPTSDHSALYHLQGDFERELASRGWKEVATWCETRHLRRDKLRYIRSLSNLHLEQVLKTGFVETTVDPDDLNRFSGIDELTPAILLSGANSLLMTKRRVKTKGKLSTVVEMVTSAGERAHIGSESVNHDISKRSRTVQLLAYFGGYHSVERRALVVHKTSVVPPHTALLFCTGHLAKEVVSDSSGNTTRLSLPIHKLEVQMPVSQADYMIKAREMFKNTFQYHVDRDVKTVEYEEYEVVNRFKRKLVKAICRILVEANREYVQGKKLTDVRWEEE